MMTIEKQTRYNPYSKYEGTALWRAVEEAVLNLEENQDLKITTVPIYVIGYICKQLEDSGIVKETLVIK